jgi:rhomboid family GlyGly-CTERM serine protease
VTVGTVVVCAIASFASAFPGGGELLQYDRARVDDGEIWRLLTGQMVHWTAQMAIADLAVLLVLGSWLEMEGRRRAVSLALGLGAVLVAAGVQLLPPSLPLYRGSSGLASALFVLGALEAVRPPARLSSRALAAGALLLFAAKLTWEIAGGHPLFAGGLPDNVEAVPLIHLLGGLAGAVAFAADRRISSDRAPRSTGHRAPSP